MILRAILVMGLVLLLAPHEPDLGLGRPGAASEAAAGPLSRLGGLVPALPAVLGAACDNADSACGTAPVLGSDLQAYALARLAQVRADIAADQAARARARQ